MAQQLEAVKVLYVKFISDEKLGKLCFHLYRHKLTLCYTNTLISKVNNITIIFIHLARYFIAPLF